MMRIEKETQGHDGTAPLEKLRQGFRFARHTRPIRALRRIFSPLGIEVGAALDPTVATPALLQLEVAALRGAWR